MKEAEWCIQNWPKKQRTSGFVRYQMQQTEALRFPTEARDSRRAPMIISDFSFPIS